MKLKLNRLANMAVAIAMAFAFSLFIQAGPGMASGDEREKHEEKQSKLGERHQEFVYGTPNVPTADWVMSSGGRLYDNWMMAQDKEGVKETHPSWPKSNTKKSGATTWRCKSCHGWDYKGVYGNYGSGSYKTGIRGVTHMLGTRPDAMAAILRDDIHQYTQEMISDDNASRIGMFISRGLHDTDAYIDRSSGATNGIASRGANIFQNICASCHGFQGTKLDWGDEGDPAYVGTESNANPWEVLHKIRNGHPGYEMIAMRAFPIEISVDILTYARTLPDR